MLTSLSLGLALLFATFALSNALPQVGFGKTLVRSDQHLQHRDPPPVVVTGIQDGATYPRLEIRTLYQNTDQWNIYLLGLSRWQATDQAGLTSYYQVAGIHGRPYIPWDNVPPAPGVTSPGYCNHVINTFTNWHRPYVALYEQTLYQNMLEVVNEFPVGPVRSSYQAALATWRLPYWDWAMQPPAGQSVFPSFLQTPNINVTTPTSQNATIKNPLFSYKFHPLTASAFYFDPFAFWHDTKRAPTSADQNATSQNSQVAAALDNNRASVASRLYNLFVNYNNFTEFGNEAWISSSGLANADSLESLHDLIHALVGLGGHMSYLDYSAFDPTFFLHHAMVDRALALWQVLYPTSFVEPMQAVEQTYTIPVNTTVTIDSPLEPFYASEDQVFWTSETSRSITTFGYSYPELYPTVNVSAVMQAINELYGTGSTGSGANTKRGLNHHSRDHLTPEDQRSVSLSTASGEESDGVYRQYFANVRSRKFASNGSYAIYFFLSDVDDDPSTWATSPSLVGVQSVIAGLPNVDTTFYKEAHPTGIPVSGTVPLTASLLDKVENGLLNSMEPSDVQQFLDRNLVWRVATFDGVELPVENVPGLQVNVVTSQVQPATSVDQFPVAKNWTEVPFAA